MKQKYYFCFQFKHITFENDVQENLQAQTHFEIQFIKNKKTVKKTNTIPYQPTPNHQITLKEETIKFTTLWRQNQQNSDTCEIRLQEIIPGGNRLLGNYQFAISNYIQAHKEFNRSCIEMAVQVGQDFKIDYIVYMESTQQALTKIMQQHEGAKKMQIFGDGLTQQECFLPQQIGKAEFQNNLKEIQFDLYSPFIVHQRFWSPGRRHETNRIEGRVKQTIQPQQQVSTQQKNSTSESRQKMMKIRKTCSTISDNSNNLVVRKLFNKKQKIISNIIEQQVQCLAEEQDVNQNFQELYEVIGNSSNKNGSILKEQSQKKYPDISKIRQNNNIVNENFKQNYLTKIGLKNVISVGIFLVLAILIFLNIEPSKISHKKMHFNSQKSHKKEHRKLKE